MTTKLTLSIDVKTIEKAKRISKRRGKSISKMVEEYLNAMNEKTTEPTSLVDNMDAILKPYLEKNEIPKHANYKELVGKWRTEDYQKTKKYAK